MGDVPCKELYLKVRSRLHKGLFFIANRCIIISRSIELIVIYNDGKHEIPSTIPADRALHADIFTGVRINLFSGAARFRYRRETMESFGQIERTDSFVIAFSCVGENRLLWKPYIEHQL